MAGGGLDALPLLSMAVAAATAVAAAADDERTSLLTSAADDGSECTEEGIGTACCFDRASRTLTD